jgi:hypothetical protein
MDDGSIQNKGLHPLKDVYGFTLDEVIKLKSIASS